MAQIFVKNALNPYKVIKVGISFKQLVDSKGTNDLIWVLELGTLSLGPNSKNIPPYFIHNVELNNLKEEVNKGVSYLAKQVDWGALEFDTIPPYVDSIYPTTYLMDIKDNLNFTIKDRLPSSGINRDSIKVVINGLDVTDELNIYGSPYEYRVGWSPKYRIFESVA